jgi:hypothetical protein
MGKNRQKENRRNRETRDGKRKDEVKNLYLLSNKILVLLCMQLVAGYFIIPNTRLYLYYYNISKAMKSNLFCQILYAIVRRMIELMQHPKKYPS